MSKDNLLLALLPSAKVDLYRPVRTYNTAAVYYHKFRLVHPDSNGYIVSTRELGLSFHLLKAS